MALAECDDLATLTALAERLCLAGHGTRELLQEGVHPAHQAVPGRVPLLHVRARRPARASRTTSRPKPCWTSRAGARRAGCKEALFTLGDQPELRYGGGPRALRALGAETTLEYLERSAALVLKETACCRISTQA